MDAAIYFIYALAIGLAMLLVLSLLRSGIWGWIIMLIGIGTLFLIVLG